MTALLLIVALVAPARGAAWTCARLEKHGRVNGEATPLPRMSAKLLKYLRAQSGNAAAARAASYLASSGIRFAAAPVSEAVGEPAAAEYDPGTRTILLEDSAQPAARLAPYVVHELFHARLRDSLGPLPPFSEEELLADAEEALFVRARGDAKPSDEHAIMLDGLSRGYDAFERTLRAEGVLAGPSVLSITEEERRAGLEDTRRLKAEHERCLAESGTEARADHESWIARLSDEERAYGDTARIARAFRAEMDAQRAELARR